jgi:serine/threonine protein kinase/tetratricopeptide (TPR) repeat protein
MSDEETIFTEALAKPSPQERSAFLDQACGGNVALRQRVEVLLAALDRAGSFLESPPADLSPTSVDEDTVQQPPAERPGQMVGAYKLLEQIGEGGMGVVFMAEQQHPVRRRVALKIIKPGMDTKQVIARFEAERQALALMDHPNIARVLEAGATDAGRPYFVMELVRGIPITDYCDQQKLSPRQRLDLFVQVCQAVQHAHQKGIIHRDLKPNNVLVTLQDGKPAPKVIDFGIAKATAGQRLTDQTLYTELRQLVGTPLYMSPEQAEMSALMDMDTRSDVYSLGVLLYELLTGTTPFDKRRLAKAAYEEVRRIIREEEPPRPSTRISTLGETLTSVSAQRQTDPKKLGHLLKGELDWIVMRALEKDRTRRYDTASGLAQDVERYLADQPVEACPPSRLYRLRKFARRNKPLIMTTGVVAAVLMLGTAVSTWQAVRARRAEQQVTHERDQARGVRQRADEQSAIAKAVNEFLNNDVLGQASVFNQPAREANPDKDLKVREALDRAATHLDGRFDHQPLVEAAIRFTIGQAYSELGEYDKAVPQLEKTLRIRRQVLGEGDADTRRSLRELAMVYGSSGELAKACSMLLQALKGQHRTSGQLNPDALHTMTYLGEMYLKQEDFLHSEPLLREALKGQRKMLGPDQRDTLYTEDILAALCVEVEHNAEAESLLQDVLERRRGTLGALNPGTLHSLANLGSLYMRQGHFEKAEPLLRQDYEASLQQFTEQSVYAISSKRELGLFYAAAGQFSQGERMVRQAYETVRSMKGDLHEFTLEALNCLARMYLDYGDLTQAEALYMQLLEGRRVTPGEEQRGIVMAVNDLGGVYSRQGRYGKAVALYQDYLSTTRQSLGAARPDMGVWQLLCNLADVEHSDHKDSDAERDYRKALQIARELKSEAALHSTLWSYGLLLHSEHRDADALPLLRECLETRLRLFPPGDLSIASVRSFLGWVLTDLGKYPDAESMLLAAYTVQTKLPPTHPHLGQTLRRLVDLYQRWERPQDAAKWMEKQADQMRQGIARNPSDPALRSAYGRLLARLGKFEDAIPIYREALDIARGLKAEAMVQETLMDLAKAYAAQRDFTRSEDTFHEFLSAKRKSLGADRPDRGLWDGLLRLAGVEHSDHKDPEAERDFQEALNIARQLKSDDALQTTLERYGNLLHAEKLDSQAEPLVRECIAVYLRRFPQGHELIVNERSFLGMVLTALKEYPEAESLLLKANSEQKALQPNRERDTRRGETLWRLVALYRLLKKPDEAMMWMEALAAQMGQAIERNPSDPALRAGHGKLLAQLAHFEDALPEYKKAIELAPTEHSYWHDGAVPLLLQLDKPEEYVRLRTRELKQFANTSDLVAAHRVSKTVS